LQFILVIRSEIGITSTTKSFKGLERWRLRIKSFPWGLKVQNRRWKPINKIGNNRKGICPVIVWEMGLIEKC